MSNISEIFYLTGQIGVSIVITRFIINYIFPPFKPLTDDEKENDFHARETQIIAKVRSFTLNSM